MTSAAPLASLIFGLTIVLVISRPRRLTEAAAALVGHWNVLLFFVGLTGTAAVAERSGLFQALAGQAVLRSNGRPRRLLVAIVVVGAVVTALLSNDAAALVLTPVVFVIVSRLGLAPLPFVLACTYVADAASIALPVSNPVNIIVSDRLGIDAASLVPVLLPAALASVLALIGCLLVVYRRALPASAPIPLEGAPDSSFAAIPVALRVGFGLAIAAFGIASAVNLPLGPTMTAVWLFLLGVEWLGGGRPGPLDGIGWSLLAFVAAMGILVDGLSASGVTGWLAQLVLGPFRDAPDAIMAVSAAAAAVGSNLANNLPAAFVLADAVHSAGLSQAGQHAAAMGTIIGADLGPNLTPIGSVATLLCFVLLRQRGLLISSWSYIRVGLLVTPVTIVAALAVALVLGGSH
jgi:arsenical pump membrane protein